MGVDFNGAEKKMKIKPGICFFATIRGNEVILQNGRKQDSA